MAGYYGGYLGNEAGMDGMLAGTPSFDLNRRPGTLGGRSGEQLKRLYEGGTKDNQQLNNELLKRGIMPGAGPQLPLAFGLLGAAGNLGALAQVNPTYPPGDPRYGQPMMQGGVPMSLSKDEFSWLQQMNQLRQKDPSSYEKVKGMMGPQGWMSPPPGFNVPPGI
jgi:hypothetical protein